MADQQLSCAGLQRGLRGLGGGRVSCFPGHGLVRVGECRLVVQQVDSSDESPLPGASRACRSGRRSSGAGMERRSVRRSGRLSRRPVVRPRPAWRPGIGRFPNRRARRLPCGCSGAGSFRGTGIRPPARGDAAGSTIPPAFCFRTAVGAPGCRFLPTVLHKAASSRKAQVRGQNPVERTRRENFQRRAPAEQAERRHQTEKSVDMVAVQMRQKDGAEPQRTDTAAKQPRLRSLAAIDQKKLLMHVQCMSRGVAFEGRHSRAAAQYGDPKRHDRSRITRLWLPRPLSEPWPVRRSPSWPSARPAKRCRRGSSFRPKR